MDHTLRKELEALRCEKAAMAHQLECQQQLIIQLQQQLAALQETVRASTMMKSDNCESTVMDSVGAPATMEKSSRTRQESCDMDSVGPPPTYPEVIIDEGDPLNVVRRWSRIKLRLVRKL
ncbi:uncharacterized protein LOC119653740 [Hermetia illucens]|uniref:uncharacterized protein LOC119653740 n=1 Tax=Hermetia illucens TaxID=343691 RepID=UPI0018CBFD6C|nr:uncharacterized protein LOC119653740 [Hermetia illucens]XP_037914592.1 uncharacterized protein LOC119653740 [Hermetia illucens]